MLCKYQQMSAQVKLLTIKDAMIQRKIMLLNLCSGNIWVINNCSLYPTYDVDQSTASVYTIWYCTVASENIIALWRGQ